MSLKYSKDNSQTDLPFNTFLNLSYVIILLQYYLTGRRIGFNEDIKATLQMMATYIVVFAG
ncbi:low temperature requirement protein A, partial [Streptococcus suis]